MLQEGDPPTQLLLLLKGACLIQHRTQVGPLTLGHALPGDLLGDMGYIDGKSHAADVVAETEVELFLLESEDLATLTDQDPDFAIALLWALWRSLSEKLRKANALLAGFFSQDQALPPSDRSAAAPASHPEFHVELSDKRDLFEEQRLSSLEINLLASLSRERHLAPGEVIFKEGALADEMYVVLSGTVLITKFIPGAGEEALAFLGRGDYFGEMALIDRQPRSAGALAHDDGATILAIPANVTSRILDIDGLSSIRLLRLLCSMVAQRLRESNGKLLAWHILTGGQSS
jgi:CRP-like cAMP-binding protein